MYEFAPVCNDRLEVFKPGTHYLCSAPLLGREHGCHFRHPWNMAHEHG